MAESKRERKGTPGSRSSVWEARYSAGPPLTSGVEEEYMLLDAETLELSGRIDDVIAQLPDQPWAAHVMPELFESTAEVATGICRTIDDARADLTAIRRGLAGVLPAMGLRLGSAGAHPFSRSEEQRITPRDRYRSLLEQLQYVARRELVFGMHVHVAVPDPETCIKVMEGVVVELPVLLALSANSPFWRGHASGLASTRMAVFAAFPRSGLPPRFESYDDYAETIGIMEATGSIGDYTHIWWDVRPHPRLGTLELRIMDVQFDIEHTLALAAYVQALVAALLDDIEHGRDPDSHHRALIAENKWSAVRYGVDAPMIDLVSGRATKATATQLARRRLKQLKPYARELGCWDALSEGVERILTNGTGAARQLRVWNANRDLHEMLGEVAGLTELTQGA